MRIFVMDFRKLLPTIVLSLAAGASLTLTAMTQEQSFISQEDNNLILAAINQQDIIPYLTQQTPRDVLCQALYHATQVGNLSAVQELLATDRILICNILWAFSKLPMSDVINEHRAIDVVNLFATNERAWTNITIDNLNLNIAQSIEKRRYLLAVRLIELIRQKQPKVSDLH
jgi:hypothetical protein